MQEAKRRRKTLVVMRSTLARLAITNFLVQREVESDGLPEAQLPADHLSISVIPLVVTDGAPVAIMVDFHSSLIAFLSPYQTKWCPYICCSGRDEKTKKGKGLSGLENIKTQF